MVSYLTGDVLFDAIESVLGQSVAPRELVVVDNGNPEHVRARLDELARVTPELQVCRGQGNVGFAAGSNLGAANTQSTHLLFLNPDCVLPADGLEKLWAEYAQLPPRSLLSPLLLNPDFTEQRGSRRAVLTPWRAAVEWLGLYHLAPSHPYFLRFNQSSEPLPLITHKVDVTSGAAMMMARSLYIVHQGASSTSPPLKVEWHKAKGFCRYFRKHFKGVYPKGFVSVINLLVWLRLVLRAPLLALRRRGAQPSQAPIESVQPTDTSD